MSTATDRSASLAARAEAMYGPVVDEPAPAARLGQLGIGWSAFERPIGYTPGMDWRARGGVVLDSWAVPDADGEAHDHHLLVRHDRGQLLYVTLSAEQLSSTSVTPPNALVVRGICRTAARAIGARKRADDREDLELFALGVRLMKAIA
jgi:hypothetical protein